MRNLALNRLKKALQPKKPSRRNRRGRFSTVETLERRLAMAIDIEFNYSLDAATTNWFGDTTPVGATTLGQLRKDVLEQAKNDLIAPIQDTLAAITPSGGNTWSVTLPHPGTGADVPLNNETIPANTMIVYVGSGRAIESDARADSGNLRFDGSWTESEMNRGQGSPTQDVGPWGGVITFNPASPWAYDNGITPGDNFYAVVQHELGHLLGFGGGSWDTHVSGGNFTGPKAVAANGGNPIPVGTHGHFASSVTNEGRRATMAEFLDPSARGFTKLDYSALDDIGWDLAEPSSGGSGGVPPTPPIPGQPRNVTVGIAATPRVEPPASTSNDLWYQATFGGRTYRTSVDVEDDGRIYIDVSSDGGNTFPERFRTNDFGFTRPALTVANGRLFIAWTGRNNAVNVAGVVLGANGVPINFDLRETTGYTSDYAPTLETDGTALILAFTGMDDEIYVDVKDTEGPKTTWGSVHHTGEFTDRTPYLSSFNGSVFLSFVEDEERVIVLSVQLLQQTRQPLQTVTNDGGAVRVDGDQLGVNYNDGIDIDRTSAGGVKVTLNGTVTEYAPGAVTNLTINTGSGTNNVRILANFPDIPLTINGHGVDSISFGSGLPTPAYTPDANGLLGWGTLTVGGQQIQHRAIEYVAGISPDLSGFVLTSATINENGLATVTGTFIDAGSYSTHSASINWGDGSSTPLERLTLGDRSFTYSHQYRDDNPTATSSDLYSITATVTDNDGRSDTASTTLRVNNVAPQLTGVTASASINENGTVTVSGSLTDVGTLDSFRLVINWGEGTPQTITLPAGSTTFSATHQYRDDNPSGTSADVYTIGLSLADDDTGVATASVTTTVSNVAPVITAHDNSNPQSNKAVEGQSITINGSFTDVGTLDTHVAQINWGDGTVTNGAVTESNGSGTFMAAHAFDRGGIFAVTTTVRDDDGGTSTAVETVFVTGAGISNVGGKRVLFVVGTDGRDNVVVQQVNATVYVVANFLNAPGGLRTFSAAAIDEIRIVLGAGNDTSVSAGMIAKPLLVDGGAGDDVIANDANQGIFGTILLGGDGKDTLVGTNARDIVIGGDGADSLTGIGGQDILIGGLTTYETGVADDNILAQEAALLSMLAEWNGSQSMAVRRANLLGTGSGSTFTNRRNGSSFFRLNETVFDDLDRDVITGGSPEADWFLLFGNDLGADYFAMFGDVNGF